MPTSASTEDLRQLINGKLADEGREPMNIQVVLQKCATATTLILRDVGGAFLEANPAELERKRETKTKMVTAVVMRRPV